MRHSVPGTSGASFEGTPAKATLSRYLNSQYVIIIIISATYHEPIHIAQQLNHRTYGQVRTDLPVVDGEGAQVGDDGGSD